jgi:hypothetical protein
MDHVKMLSWAERKMNALDPAFEKYWDEHATRWIFSDAARAWDEGSVPRSQGIAAQLNTRYRARMVCGS